MILASILVARASSFIRITDKSTPEPIAAMHTTHKIKRALSVNPRRVLAWINQYSLELSHVSPFQEKPFHHRGTPTIKGPLYLILPQKYCHKIKYKRRTLGRRFSTHHVPRCILQRGEETTRVKRTTSE
ncbi:hypothetical protein JTE90_018983 [Oedothorax gibbosus]|uniref:Secreted protein n=1 Tax=Oedothorax gibbosus TaxID=931172 RepID=A0AAV6TFW1_9ARAC|nr:hypothetical protein JTE90_018983 [Oedothorax gibbosus]